MVRENAWCMERLEVGVRRYGREREFIVNGRVGGGGGGGPTCAMEVRHSRRKSRVRSLSARTRHLSIS